MDLPKKCVHSRRQISSVDTWLTNSRRRGCRRRAVGLDEWFQIFDSAENRQLDLREKEACRETVVDGDLVYNLAADMEGWVSSKTTKHFAC